MRVSDFTYWFPYSGGHLQVGWRRLVQESGAPQPAATSRKTFMRPCLAEAPQGCWNPPPGWTDLETLNPATCPVLIGPTSNADPWHRGESVHEGPWGAYPRDGGSEGGAHRRHGMDERLPGPWERGLCVARLGFQPTPLARRRKQREGDGPGVLSRSQSPYCIALGSLLPTQRRPRGARSAKGEVSRQLSG